VLIYLLRHGIAIDREDPACPPDSDRQLTDKGVRRTRAAMRGLAALDVAPDLAFTSPYARARETALIAMEELGLAGDQMIVSDALLEDEPEPLCLLLREHGPEVALCVGHAPSLDIFASYLIGSDEPVTRLKKAGVACLDAEVVDAGGAELVAVYPPRALRELGERSQSRSPR
jgi:phosphohistidine phosphatase